MGTITYALPQSGLPNATEDVKVVTALNTLLTFLNGNNIDGTNTSNAFNQSAGVNGASIVKGASVNAGPGTRTNAAYGALSDAPDQVAGIVLPTNGLITVWYQATWQESVQNGARAAIFIGANQLKYAAGAGAAPSQEVGINQVSTGIVDSLATWSAGLQSTSLGSAYSGDVTTGQIVGLVASSTAGQGIPGSNQLTGGPCYIFAAAGTYAISVQFKASSGTVTASNRRLWVKAESFA